MPSAQAQLNAIGPQNLYLDQDSDITFWKALTRKHTPFALETVEVPFSGNADFGTRVTANIPRQIGDLLKSLWLEVTLPDLSTFTVEPTSATNIKYVNSIGHALINTVEYALGGSRIDRHLPEYLDIYAELNEKDGKMTLLKEMIGKYDEYDNTDPSKSFSGPRLLYIPLPFSFAKCCSNALPVVALTNNEVQLNLEFNPILSLIKSSVATVTAMYDNLLKPPSMTVKLMADYVCLGADEREDFRFEPHEYLVETLQFMGDENILAPLSSSGSLNRRINLNFSQPVKELIWVYVAQQNYTRDSLNGNDIFNYNNPGDAGKECFDEVTLQLDGVDRFNTTPGFYFRVMQPYRYHAGNPGKRIYMYSFAIDPLGSQPSGACNMSRISSAQFQFRLNPGLSNGIIKIYAVAWNVLRIADGYAQLMYAGA